MWAGLIGVTLFAIWTRSIVGVMAVRKEYGGLVNEDFGPVKKFLTFVVLGIILAPLTYYVVLR